MRVTTQAEFCALSGGQLRDLITDSGGWLDVVIDDDGELKLAAYPKRMVQATGLWVDLDDLAAAAAGTR